jgi:formylglycine-generating enzyme required for sulfatase activity
MDWVTVGDPGNACDPQSQGCFGAVPSTYRISKYETTNTQYAEFLNAVATTDPNALYSTSMGSSSQGGIKRSGNTGSYSYNVKSGFADRPVNFVSFWNSLRFANWLHNGQPVGVQDAATTEDGAYTMTAAGIAANTITRNAGATIFLTSEDEWYKAAYYDGVSASYFDYPAASDVLMRCAAPGAEPNTANCNFVVGTFTNVGAYTGSVSPAGTFDQGGNLWEWNEAIISGSTRSLRGGGSWSYPQLLAASNRKIFDPAVENFYFGFRVAMIPEPNARVPALPLFGIVCLGCSLLAGGLVTLRRRNR